MASFRDQIQSYAGTGGFVSRTQERALLRIGTSGYGLGYDDARGAVFDAAAADSLVLESAVEGTVADYLRTQADRTGRVSRSDFRSAVELYRSRARGRLGQEQAASRVKDLMIRHGLSARPNGLVLRSRRWFNRVPLPAQETVEEPLPVSAVVARAPVEATLRAWEAAFNAGDVAGVLSLYAPDALLLATAAPDPRRGPGAMRSYFDQLMIARSASVRFASTLSVEGNDPATTSGLYEFRYTDPVRGPVVTPARFTYVVGRIGAGEVGAILLHHSSAVPFDGAGGCPV